jgi:hypothetical protein
MIISSISVPILLEYESGFHPVSSIDSEKQENDFLQIT